MEEDVAGIFGAGTPHLFESFAKVCSEQVAWSHSPAGSRNGAQELVCGEGVIGGLLRRDTSTLPF